MVWDTDVNDDGKNDAVDIGIVRASFMTANPAADVDNDGDVDGVDIGYTRYYFMTEVVGTYKWDKEEEDCFESINLYRADPASWQPVLNAQGEVVPASEVYGTSPLPPFQPGYKLSQASQWMAQDQADHKTLEHTDSTGRDMGARVVAFMPDAASGYIGECALGTDGGGQPASGEHSHERWTLSPGHNTLLLVPNYQSIGIGHAISPTPGPQLPNDFQHRWYINMTTELDTSAWPP